MCSVSFTSSAACVYIVSWSPGPIGCKPLAGEVALLIFTGKWDTNFPLPAPLNNQIQSFYIVLQTTKREVLWMRRTRSYWTYILISVMLSCITSSTINNGAIHVPHLTGYSERSPTSFGCMISSPWEHMKPSFRTGYSFSPDQAHNLGTLSGHILYISALAVS